MSNDDDSVFPDYYALLNVPATVNDSDLKKAWRRKAIELHPDKHPEEADKYSTLFDTAKKAFELLTDPKQRAAYNEQLAKVAARKQAAAERQKRYANEDKRIQQMRIQLEQQEREAANVSTAKRVKLNEDVQRAQTNSYIQQLKQQRIEEQQRQQRATNMPDKPVMHQSYNPNPHNHSHNSDHNEIKQSAAPINNRPTSISIKWPKNDASTASLYSESYLRAAFGVYGHILHIVLNSQRYRAIIVYERQQSAMAALDMIKIDSKLKVKLLDDNMHERQQNDEDDRESSLANNSRSTAPSADPHNAASSDVLTDEQYEAQTLARMQAAAAARKARLKAMQSTAASKQTVNESTSAPTAEL